MPVLSPDVQRLLGALFRSRLLHSQSDGSMGPKAVFAIDLWLPERASCRMDLRIQLLQSC